MYNKVHFRNQKYCKNTSYVLQVINSQDIGYTQASSKLQSIIPL